MTGPLGNPATPDIARDPRGAPELRSEVLAGLLAERKTLHPKLFYDALGAELFERITRLPEYYLTRAELEILRARAGEVADLTGANATLIEYGSGAGVKIRILLDALHRPSAYIPIDISSEQLAHVAGEIAAEYPGLAVRPVCADYTRPLQLPRLPADSPRLAFFPGSTIGNFHPTEAAAFLGRIRRTVGAGGQLLLGVDRVKDPAVIEAAYDDAAGVTAAFNLNVLRRLNRDLGANFDLSAFSHRASYNRAEGRVEMHLVSLANQRVTIGGTSVSFDAGESIWTESSYKYDRERLDALVRSAGFGIARLWSDEREQFWVALLRAEA